jgi:hypothetical protein
MLRRWGLLAALTSLLAAGCSIDRVEWESSGFPVEQVRHALEEEYGMDEPSVECIQREVQGGEWECRADNPAGEEFHCHATTNTPRRRVYELECEPAHHAEEGKIEHEETETVEEH